MNNGTFFKQKHFLLLGAFRQLLGGIMTWVTLLTFLFAGLAAWNTDSAQHIRDHAGWLNLGWAAVVVVLVMLAAMWCEHKWMQPSIMNYWLRMFYDQGNPMRDDQERTEEKVDLLLEYMIRSMPDSVAAEMRGRLDEINEGNHASGAGAQPSANPAAGRDGSLSRTVAS